MTCKEDTVHIPCWSATPVFEKPSYSYSLPQEGQGEKSEGVKDVELSEILSSPTFPPGSTAPDQACKAPGTPRTSQRSYQYPRRGLWGRIPTLSTSTLRTLVEIVIVLCSISVGVTIIVRVLFSGVTQTVTQLAMLKEAEVSRIDAYMVSFVRAAQKLQATWAIEAFTSNVDLDLTLAGPGVDTYLVHMLASSKSTRSVVVATEDTWTGAFYDAGGAGMLVGVANTTCITTYRINEASRTREGGAPYSVTCPFDAKAWYDDRIATRENKTSLALDPFTNRVGLLYTAMQSATAKPMVVVSYLDTVGLGRQLQRYADLAFESETNKPRSMASHWDGVSIFLFTTYEPYYIVATSTAKTQALLEGDTMYDASNIPNPHISSAVKTIMTSPLSTIHELPQAFVSSALVEGDLCLGVTVSRAHVYRYEGDSLKKVYLATCIMVLILGIYSSRRYWLPPFYKLLRALITAAGDILRIPSKAEPSSNSVKEVGTSGSNNPPVSPRFLTAFIASIFIINTMIMVYKLESVVRIKESLRFRHNTEVVADLVHDVAEGAVRTLDYAIFMTEEGFVPVRNDVDDVAALQTFLVSVVQHAHEASSVEILEAGFSDGRVEAAVYYTVTGENEELAVISNGELAGNVYTIFKPEMIGKNTSTEGYIFKNPVYNLYKRPWYLSTHGKKGLCYNEPFLWYSSHQYGVSWGKETVHGDRTYIFQSGIFLNQISGYLREITLAKNDGTNGDTIFIMSGTNALLASSSGNTQRDVCDEVETITPDASFSAGVNRTYSALTTRFGNPQSWPKTISPFLTGGDSTLGPMFVSVTTLEGISGSFMDWSLVLSSSNSSYYEVSRGVEIVVILISGIIILLTFANIQLSNFTALRKPPASERLPTQLDPFLEPINVDLLVKDFIKHQAQLCKPFKERYNTRFHSMQHALDYIGLSTKRVDLWTFLRLEERKAWQRKLFYMHRSSKWNTFILLVFFCHCALAFAEAPCRTTISNADLDFNYQLKLLVVRATCLIFLWIDSLAEILIGGLYTETLVKEQQAGGEVQCRLSKSLNIRLISIIFILVFMSCDYLVAIATLYTTQGLSDHLYFLLPISTFLRPILAILRIPEIFMAAKMFLITTYRSLPTMTLILVILLVSAVLNVILFKGDIESAGLLQGRTFDNLINSLIQTTLFVLTHSNFQIATQVVNCPLGPNGFYSNGCPKAVAYLYFTFISSIGYIVFLAVMVMSFQIEYFRLARAEATKARSRDRVTYIAAFLLIEDDEGKVSGWNLRAFFKKVEKRFDYPIRVKIYDSDAVGLEEFVDLMEQFHPYMEARTRFLKHTQVSARSSSGIWRLCQLVLQYCYNDSLQYCILVIGLTTSALYGLVNIQYFGLIYTLNLIFFIYFFLETVLRVCVMGIINFWYVPYDVFKESNNRYNLILNAVSVFIILLTVSLDQLGNVASRVILFMPMLRILCAMRWMRILFLAVIRILFKIFWLSIFGLLVFYLYAIVGIFLYAGAYQDFIEYNQTYSLFNFNSLADALWTLWACFVSSAISHVFLASIDAGEIFYSVLYFLSFIILFRLVFMRILVAVLVDSYRRIDSIIARSPNGIISTFEFWRSMKEEGRLEEGRWVKIRVHSAEEGTGGNFFEITFLKKSDAIIENSRRFRTQEVDWSTVSEHVRWLSNCSSGLAADGISGESRREILDCIEQWEADLQVLKDRLSNQNRVLSVTD